MKITILTLFPDMFNGVFSNSIMKRAIGKGLVDVEVVDIRKYTKDKNGRVDSAPIGGGAGLIMQCQPILDCLNDVKTENSHTILLSAKGRSYTQDVAKELVKLDKDLILICGHYEGTDERINKYVDELISIGDYVVTGGEIPAMIITDSVTRLLDGVITNESLSEESFNNGLIEYPQYAEPYEYNGDKVPDILYCGNHEAIRKYRLKESLRLTKEIRPDLLENRKLTKEEKSLLAEIEEGNDNPKWMQQALKKGKKFIKE